MLLLCVFTFTSALTGPMVVLASTTETVVGVVGGKVLLPCRLATANQKGVEVCWGRGQPSLFTCHNTLLNTEGGVATYRSSYRFSVSSSVYGGGVSMSILKTQPSDSGFYHCRVQVPGPFNDQTFSIHLIVINPWSVVSDSSASADVEEGTPNAPHTTVSYSGGDLVEQTGSDIATENSTGPMVAQVQLPVQQQQLSGLKIFIGNTVRVSFIIFIPAILLTAAYRVWRLKQKAQSDRRLDQSVEEEESPV